ncbi:MAG: D-alanyl-D-alanine carboxypeptidase/D-alanyl-D-alanine-endopeptidase [bacterium]
MIKRILPPILLFLLWGAAPLLAASELSERIEALISRPAYAETQWGICIYSLTHDSLIYGYEADKLFVPASTVKLLTSAAALDSLGPDYRFETAFLTNGVLDSTGTLGRDLIVRGSGDPTLKNANGSGNRSGAFQQITDSLRQRGLRQIRGRIVGDARAWPRGFPCLSWEIGDLEEDWTPVTGALSLNRSDAVGDSLFVVMETSANSSAVWSPSPTFAFLSDLRRALHQGGISLLGHAQDNAQTNGTSTLYVHTSAPLCEIIKPMNKKSDNFCAEQFALVLGGGSSAQGLQVVSRFLTKAGIDTRQVRLADASGLSRKNLLSPAIVVQLLKYMNRHPFASEYKESLAVMGTDGTLGNRYVRMPGTEVCGKTGTLDYVSALSGYLRTKTGEEIAFSLLCNNFLVSSQTIQQVQDSICTLLAKER